MHLTHTVAAAQAQEPCQWFKCMCQPAPARGGAVRGAVAGSKPEAAGAGRGHIGMAAAVDAGGSTPVLLAGIAESVADGR